MTGMGTFKVLTVRGRKSRPSTEAVMEGLQAHAFADFRDDAGRSSGWVGPRHALDLEFTRENTVRGRFVAFGLRMDRLRVPPVLLRARVAVELEAAAAVQGRVPPRERREIRRRVKAELEDGVLASVKVARLAWDRRARLLYVGSTARGVLEEVADLMDRSFEVSLDCRGPGTAALERARALGLADEFSDLEPMELAGVEAG